MSGYTEPAGIAKYEHTPLVRTMRDKSQQLTEPEVYPRTRSDMSVHCSEEIASRQGRKGRAACDFSRQRVRAPVGMTRQRDNLGRVGRCVRWPEGPSRRRLPGL